MRCNEAFIYEQPCQRIIQPWILIRGEAVASPGAADSQVDRGVLRTARHIQPRLQTQFPGQAIAKSDPPRRDSFAFSTNPQLVNARGSAIVKTLFTIIPWGLDLLSA